MTRTDPIKRAARALESGRAAAAIAYLDGQGAPAAQAIRARALCALGRAGDGAAALDSALDAAPADAALWMERALVAHAAGDGAAVVKRLRAASMPAALLAMVKAATSGQGARAQGTGAAGRRDLAQISERLRARDRRGVERLAGPLLARKPGAVLFAMLGQARLDAADGPAAAEAFGQGARLEPFAADLRLGLARAQARAGRMAHALAEARRAARLAPAWPEAQAALARLSLAADLPDAALAAAQAAARTDRSDAMLTLLAEAALAARRPDLAIDAAAARRVDAPGRAAQLARAQSEAGEVDAALDTYAQALARTPENADLLVARGQLRQSLGAPEAAEADLRAAIALRPDHGLALRALAYGAKLDPADPAVAAMRAALDAPDATDRRLAAYALARAEEPSDPDAAFAHLAAAKAAQATAFPHDPGADRAGLDRALARRDALRDVPDSGCDAAPIFVTGLPRSGTTLVEAMLAAHPEVTAGGELGLLPMATRTLRAALDLGEAVTAAEVTAAGDAYAQAARRLTRAPGRWTDKSIHSFTEIGLIARILPHARVVVVHRDPRDVALSIWRNHFPDGTQRYAATPEGIADHVALFREAVTFWRDALPAGRFHEIAYENLLDAPETCAREMLAACGLDWDDRVLSFHESAGRVDTLSFDQVRRPLYTSSKGGWRRHADRIGPLLDALEARGLPGREG